MSEAKRRALAAQAVDGDADALQELILHYHPVWCGVIDGRLAGSLRRHIDPEDILQQAYITAFKTIGGCTFDGPGGFYKWLEELALAQLRDVERKLRRRKRDIVREMHVDSARRPAATCKTSYPDLLQQLSSPGSTPSRRLARAEASAALLSSLARLTDDQRNVVRLRFLDGRPAAQVAAALGKSEDAVYALCHRGLEALRKRMESATRRLPPA